jgi:hypothetical protein
MVSEGDCVAIFHSIHRVMKAEKILQAMQQDVLLIPVPRQLSADCGMALRFHGDLRVAVIEVLSQRGMKVEELWLKTAEGFSRQA